MRCDAMPHIVGSEGRRGSHLDVGAPLNVSISILGSYVPGPGVTCGLSFRPICCDLHARKQSARL
jgi:hypothetical protein